MRSCVFAPKRRSGREDDVLPAICEKKLYEKHFAFTCITIRLKCVQIMCNL